MLRYSLSASHQTPLRCLKHGPWSERHSSLSTPTISLLQVVALCPRSNATIGLNPPPIAAYLAEGNGICIGTDSLASSPSLDLLEDVKLLRDLALDQGYEAEDLSRRLLRAATLGGAKALGMDSGEQGVGSLESGKRADLAVFDLATTAESAETSVVAEGSGRCIATILAGELRADTGRQTKVTGDTVRRL
jgi:cytosine/adenosine deaminase-related metal-dependent hydrolase